MPDLRDELNASDVAAREAVASHTVGIIVTDDCGNRVLTLRLGVIVRRIYADFHQPKG
jgi:hypothetical protein